MRTDITHQQIDRYQEQGFIVIEDFLSLEELATWREAVDAAVAARGHYQRAASEPEDDYYANVFIQSMNLWQDSPRVRRIMFDARLGKLAADLAGVDGIRIWHDQALIKRPWANPTSWHQDCPYWSFSSPDAISIWVALDDATLYNGCLFFLPGTHKKQFFDYANIGANMGDIFRVHPEYAAVEAVAAPMRAGSCSFHNGLLIHAAHANMTPRMRRAMTCQYMPDGSTFNGKRNILPKVYMDSLKIGDVLEDDSHNPLIYSRTRRYVTA